MITVSVRHAPFEFQLTSDDMSEQTKDDIVALTWAIEHTNRLTAYILAKDLIKLNKSNIIWRIHKSLVNEFGQCLYASALKFCTNYNIEINTYTLFQFTEPMKDVTFHVEPIISELIGTWQLKAPVTTKQHKCQQRNKNIRVQQAHAQRFRGQR